VALRRIRTCVAYAAGFATVYSVVAVLRYAGNPATFAALGLPPLALLGVYWAGALAAGVAVGVLWPLARTVAGAPLVGVVAAFPLLCGVVLLRARPGEAQADVLLSAALLSLVLGGIGGAALHYVFTDGE